MIKIPTMFMRDESIKGHPVINVVTPGCEWVLAGEGIATVKFDGTNVKVEDRVLYKRQKPKTGDYDYASYVPCDRMNAADDWAFQAFDSLRYVDGNPTNWPDGIYELIGPKVQGNPYGLTHHTLLRVVPRSPAIYIPDTTDLIRDPNNCAVCGGVHIGNGAWEPCPMPSDSLVPRDFDGLREYLTHVRWEGIVFHHSDGRMAKIKRRDFGLPWPCEPKV